MEDYYWLAVVCNIRRARNKCVRLMQLLVIEVADAWLSIMFYVAVLQAVLLSGSETWVMYPFIGRTLGGFHHRVAYGLMGRQL